MNYTVRPISDRSAFTGSHRRSQFQSSWPTTERLLFAEVKHLRGKNLVLELDVREQDLRLDGGLRANARPTTPAVRVAFDSMHGPLTYATDRFTTWQDNVRAVALGLEALRKVDRYGITKRGEQYAGWKALPGGRSMPPSHMTTEQAYDVLAGVLDLRDIANLDVPDATLVRRAKAAAHPDRNDGDRTLWDQVEQAARVLGVDQ